jgi:hypothetical protein
MRTALALACLVAATAVAGCGGRSETTGTAPGAGAAAEAARPALAAAARRPGEILVTGEGSPAAHGPYAFAGRYLVRFEQIAPEDPRLDFSGQTAFVASADPRAGQPGAGSVRLFRAAARTGRRSVTLRGRMYVDVGFGDFPYAIRFTPTERR